MSPNLSLNWRLVVSYALIIVFTLFLALIVLIIIARPLQNRLAIIRLTAQANNLQTQINDQLQSGAPRERIEQLLNRRAAANGSRILLLTPHGEVQFDTQEQLTGQSLTLPHRNGELTPNGTFTPPVGQPLNYAVVTLGQADAPAGLLLAVAPRTPAIPRVITELGWGFMMAGCLSLLASLLAGAFIARSIALPLQTIAQATGAIAAGDYSQQVPESGPPEIQRVAASFNAMAGQVSANQQAMRDFVSNVSHELKTPLTSIQGFSQAIAEGATPDEAATRRAAKIIHEEAGRMARLVEDLLDLARIDSGQVVMRRTPLDLTQILAATLDRLRPQAAAKNITLESDGAALPAISGDGDRLAQVFTNLLDNAIRHTPGGGRVSVAARVLRNLPRPRPSPAGAAGRTVTAISERADFVEISIGDTGPGIPPEDLARIFERFYQVDKSRKRGQGTGLGLAIIKEIVDAHGGVIRANSQPGEGTTFVVLLPLSE